MRATADAFETRVMGRRMAGLLWQSEPGGSEMPSTKGLAGDHSRQYPTLALHGWLDNAASFSVLAPLLQLDTLLAIDLPGHGWSDHRPPPGDYAIWDDLLELLALADQLGWQRFQVLGHSRGAFIALLLAAVAPERVQRVALLDGVWPPPVEVNEAPLILQRYVQDQRKLAEKRMPRYSTIEHAVAVWEKASGLHSAGARMIVERGLKSHEEGGYTWRSDPRLTLGSAFKLSDGHNRAFLQAVQAPLYVLLATRGYGGKFDVTQALGEVAHADCELLDADHHLHMGPDTRAVAKRLNHFFHKSYDGTGSVEQPESSI